MMKSALYLSCCTVLLSSFLPIRELSLELGAPVPQANVACMDVSGKEISLQTAKGPNGLLVVFAGNRCPYMIRNQERLRRACAFAQQNNIGVALVNSNEATRNDGESLSMMKAYASQQQLPGYYLLDKNALLADAFDANHTPECFLFDKHNKLVYKGGIDDNPGNADAVKVPLLQNALNEMLAGKSVTTAASGSLGCNIKRKL
ncbi:redoxin family protein [Chitinophaga nivalis]|uniref:Redoxin family protein n=1 Tax=Chitinophaga nivalis TaxID=2991709 RepID=A0ABT3IQL5_9BACT|nr:redoxin family protein [Chitinophaga nivalis]MCW3464065.1 redoxin family protein [Chitinophaga nivalis]MCW3486245.1 redoxin family protein [Chitinophaga nivalis]